MERIQVLIDKLNEQKRNGESASQLLVTVQLLQQELLRSHASPSPSTSSKVVVVLPGNQMLRNVEEDRIPAQNSIPQEIQVPKTPAPIVEEQPIVAAQPKKEDYNLHKPPAVEKKEYFQLQDNFPGAVPYDLVHETPTLNQQTAVRKEVNELLTTAESSLNDKLKEEKIELVHKLKDSPIKDLKKGIGINDKFLFLSELFRGDEDAYERSLKTINGFNILAEAEYWINRELKVKLGWNDSNEVVQHFYHLVRRRFS